MKTFRFGVNVGPSRSRAEWLEKARKLEDLGYSTLTVPDHLSDFFAPMPALISAAEATKNLRVGTNVLNNDFRHPVLVAREAATIDLLTEGRLQLGLGAGYVQLNTNKRVWTSMREAPGSSDWQKRSPLSKACSRVNRSRSLVGIIA
jgi:alkanesulfonate monooxygenase SsuD/methylene tetrahydromethanopterin reductase-like flavin-dependent oxidoreductase (luciferase family)